MIPSVNLYVLFIPFRRPPHKLISKYVCQTLCLLHRSSPDLTRMSYANHMQALKTSTDLSLPLGISPDLNTEQKIGIGQRETAWRAMEVEEAVFNLQGDPKEAVADYVRGFQEVCEVLHDAQGPEQRWIVWQKGLYRVLEMPRSSGSGLIVS